ncbi:hypothetical protein H0H93_009012 [Arthromyces matolae]|nr:hypothetical protein H0H93_009012 [Arthromyces matolae]
MSFNSLADTVQRDIDRAFDEIAPDSEGGFEATQAALGDLPKALRKLGLPHDDEQVLAVFRNAASGWSSSSSTQVKNSASGWVSREDWRAVCAVLMEEPADEDAASSLVESDDVPSDDQYLEDDEGDDDDDDEYLDENSSRRRTRGASSKSNLASSSLSPSVDRPSKRQMQATLEAFSLFFPDSVPLEDIPKQRIMIKDVQRVAKILGEKIKADEMIEMLDAFSTMPDKSVSLEDFGRIMRSAKLV